MFFAFLLLVYYWWFYFCTFKRVEKPAGVPSKPPMHNLQFSSNNPNHFQFVSNGKQVWEHTLPPDTFTFYQDKIVQIDPCHGVPDGQSVIAAGKHLYEYLMENPETKDILKFKENSERTIQTGSVYHFKCLNGRVNSLNICSSGFMFVDNACQPINCCTGKENGSLLYHEFVSHYIECKDGAEIIRKCPNDEIFHHNRCESIKKLHHYCKIFPDVPLLLDKMTRVECRNGKPFYITCKPGTRFFEKDYCESALCDGVPDDARLPLPEQKSNPFIFSPGYVTCRQDRIQETVTCPQSWPSIGVDDNLTFLPMVFDGQKCEIPKFCVNVFSNDKDLIVPVHDFTKHVKNWKFSELLDNSTGYVCTHNVRKRKILSPELRISKRFKEEPACQTGLEKLPILYDEDSFYDCALNQKVSCPFGTFFNGSTNCVPKPTNAFTYKNVPLFEFDSLNLESWIKPWDYSKDKSVAQCKDPESEHVQMYNICSHPDCTNYAFVSQIPELTILLPREDQAKCIFYEGEKTLKKEHVDFDYHFWDQSKMDDPRDQEKPCTPGQNIQTGNFIWDKTVFATCNMDQPFIFCPSVWSDGIIPVKDQFHFACKPPVEDIFTIESDGKTWVHFEKGEIQRILPLTDKVTHIRLNKSAASEILPKEGLYIPEGDKITLQASESVQVEPRYRVTYPPNVAFKYPFETLTADKGSGFLVKLHDFSKKALSYPRYKPIIHVDSFDKNLYL